MYFFMKRVKLLFKFVVVSSLFEVHMRLFENAYAHLAREFDTAQLNVMFFKFKA